MRLVVSAPAPAVRVPMPQLAGLDQSARSGKSLRWPAMTIGFGVKDKTSMDKLAVGNKVHVKFSKQGENYVITSVK